MHINPKFGFRGMTKKDYKEDAIDHIEKFASAVRIPKEFCKEKSPRLIGEWSFIWKTDAGAPWKSSWETMAYLSLLSIF